ncbi:MAG TPA: hypothetical protein VF796_04805 [Humisphaera sp.]
MKFGRAARFGVLGLSAFAFVAGGCAARNEMPSRRLARPHKPSPVEQPYFAPEVDQSAVNLGRLSGLPVQVQASFTREYPAAGITSVQQIPSGTGPMLYRISYIDGGTPGQVTYRASGQDMADDRREVIIRDSRPAQPAPGVGSGATTGID